MKKSDAPLVKKVISRFLIRRGFRRLVRRMKTLPDLSPEQVLDFVFSKEAELIQPWQFREEFIGLAREIYGQNARTMMEIGTANGGTLFTACRLVKEDALIISLDLPSGAFGGGYPEWKMPIYSSFARKNQQIHLLRADSHTNESLNEVKKILGNRQLDYLFIDGDHTYKGVKQDFEMYSPFVRKGGIIAFHDIVKHPDTSCQVDLFWEEIKQKYPAREYVRDWNQRKFGIGIITV